MKKYNLLSINPHKHNLLFLLILLMFIFLWLVVSNVKTFDTLTITGLIECKETCTISLTLPYDKIDIFNNDSFISYKNKNYNIKNLVYEDPYLNGEIAYQDIIFETNLSSSTKLINFTILSNRQTLIEKIKNIILER